MLRVFLASLLLLPTLACGDDATPADGSTSDCTPVTCEIACTDGFRRGADGCEICECNPTPDRACADDGDCVLTVDYEDCCGCATAYNASSIDGHSCVRPRGELVPPGCAPDPTCEGTACRCEYPYRAVCEAGSCEARSDCPPGEIMELGGCVQRCTTHTDCTLAADYGSCCGSCQTLTRATVDADPCLAERASDSECSPGPGACDGLGCASAPLDCLMFGEAAVCMADGTCNYGGAGGSCPGGSMEMGGVCVPTP